MAQLGQLSEQLSAAAVGADVTDVQGLAQLHTSLLDVVSAAYLAVGESATGEGGGMSPESASKINQVASEAGKLVEGIILEEFDDADAAMKRVLGTVEEIRALIEGKSVEASAASVETAPVIAKEEAEKHHEIEDEQAVSEADLPLVQEFIGEARTHIETAEAEILKLEENPEDLEAINAVFRSFHTIKGVAGFLNLKQIGALAHAAENLLDLARNQQLKVTRGVIDVVLESSDCMKAMVGSLEEAVKQGRAMGRNPGVPPLLKRIERVAKNGGEDAEEPEAPRAEKSAVEKSSSQGASSSSQSKDATVKISTERLDVLINTVGELVIAQSMVSQDMAALTHGNQRLVRNLAHLGKITRELQDLSMSMRMVPVQGVFQKMARLVRDLSRRSGKQVELELSGGETELDRNVVETISDPLVHMIRNSLDHGIEPAEQRVKAGKSEVGHVTLKAYHHGGNFVIEITDDGRGLNKQRILEKATERGLVQPGQELSEQEIFRLIFHPGLSTAEKLTDVSGRGVGMDVVKKNIEALRGRIDIVSTLGKGSTFTIRLPLTLAVIDGMVVRVGSQRYIIPTTGIERSLRPTTQQLSTVQGRGEMCMVRGKLLPIFRLHRLFNVQDAKTDPTEALAVIVQDNERRCCLLVDDLLSQQQVVIKSLGECLGNVPGISGGAILGDGNVSLILDVPKLIDIASDVGAETVAQ